MEKETFIDFMQQHPELQEDLFIRGFLITDQKQENLQKFPFFGNWRQEHHGNYYFLAHKLTGMHIYEDGRGRCFFLMGHAYNPFTMEYKEENILRHIAAAYGTDDYMERINDLTGIFVYGDLADGVMHFLVDPAGIQSACWGMENGKFYLSSHAQLVGDLCSLKMDPFVSELVNYKWYNRLLGPYLPGDLTPFSSLKRIIPNTLYTAADQVTHKRFWPLQDAQVAVEPDDYDRVIRQSAEILKNNMALVSEKWENPWISLTGGIDSNTTFAAGNGHYDRFHSFSYISAEKEVPDAAAARKIAEHFAVPHHEFPIPDENSQVENFDEIRKVLMHNNGYVAETKDNEIRKRITLRREAKCDVEVKSWVSETIRAYWFKYYGRKKMPRLSPKLYRNFYKIFLMNRVLAHKVDRLYSRYLKEYEYDRLACGYPAADLNYEEIGWGSWGSINISEMKYCFDITIIYNNRRVLDLLFRVPLEKRILDQHHLDMKKVLNKELFDMKIRVKNLKETNFRAFALNVLFTINSFLPF